MLLSNKLWQESKSLKLWRDNRDKFYIISFPNEIVSSVNITLSNASIIKALNVQGNENIRLSEHTCHTLCC